MNSILEDFKMAFRSGNILNQLIIINLAVFALVNILLFVVLKLAGQDVVYYDIVGYLSLPSNPAQLIYQPLAFISYMFLHADFLHILSNMLFLYWFGKIITEYLGQNKILGLYVWGGLAGAALYLVAFNTIPFYSDVANRSILMGASAGVLAVVVAAATFKPDHIVHLFLLGPIKMKWIALFFVIMSFFRTVGENAGGELAHLGGAALGYFFMRQLQQNGNDWSKPVVSFVIWCKSFFKPQPKIKVTYKNEEKFGSGKKTKAKARPTKKAASQDSNETSQAEIDAILDKISEKGYDALSKTEKQKLFNASKD